jgi:hypothetical protein
MPRKKQENLLDLNNPLLTEQDKQELSLEELSDKKLSVSVTCSRKLNLSAYGGTQYETIDVSSTISANDLNSEEYSKVRQFLFSVAKAAVESDADLIQNEIRNANSQQQKMQITTKTPTENVVTETYQDTNLMQLVNANYGSGYLENAMADCKISYDELIAIKQWLIKISNAKTQEEVLSLKTELTAAKDTFKEPQLRFLQQMFLKTKQKLGIN